MKRISLLCVLLLSAIVCLAFSACGKTALDIPAHIVMDEENTLSWTLDENAKSYELSITNVETGEEEIHVSRKASYSLSKLKEGDYDIKVRSVSDGKKYGNSEWSDVKNFHKSYETGCIYTPVKNNTEYEITKVGSASGTVYIESVYRGKPVTSIAEAAFKGSGRIEAVEVGENITYIGDNAFYNCSKLGRVVLPNSVTYLGISAFQSCRMLETINIPDGLKQISDYTFAYCRSLESIEIPDSVISIGNSAFSDCSALKEIVIPDGVTSIGEYAFTSNVAATSVKIGKNVGTIGKNAFCKCDVLAKIEFAEGSAVKVIGDYAFSECNGITEVVLPEGTEDIGMACFYKSEKVATVSIPDTVTHVGPHAFTSTKMFNDAYENDDPFIYADNWLIFCKPEKRNELTTLSDADFRDNVFGIADNTFEGAQKLLQVSVPASVKVIGKYVFAQCPVLWKIDTTDDSVEIIDDYCFFFCPVLRSISFAPGLKKIGAYAFYSCVLLDNTQTGTSIIPDTVTSIGTNAFKKTKLYNSPVDGVVYAGNWAVGYGGSVKTTTITIREGTIGVSDYAFYGLPVIEAFSGLTDVRYIGKGAFYGCSELASVSLNRNLKKIPDYAFYGCVKLKDVSLPFRLQEIGRSAFYACESLEELDTEGTEIIKIGDYAFYGCVKLGSVLFENTLEEIGNYAFFGNTELKEITLPSSLVTVGDKAFYQCSALAKLDLGDGVKELGDSAFAHCDGLTEINIPASLEKIGDMVFYLCSNVEKITFSDGVKEIGHYAFAEMKKVEEVILPVSLESIGNYAFKGMSGLKSLVIPANVKKIGAHAIYWCNQITVYAEGEGVSAEWNSKFNSSFRPIVWNCTLSENKDYVVSVEIKENGLSNVNEMNEITPPVRAGYSFEGWAKEENSETPDLETKDIVSARNGDVLYAVWKKTEL